MIQLPNNKKCYNLPEQVAQNLLNIQYLAEQYKNIDELPSIWADYKTAFDADLHTFEDWTTTFEGWENTLATYLANMSSAAVGAIAGQDIAPKTVSQTQANWGGPFTLSMDGSMQAGGLTLTNIYNHVEVINGVFWIVVNVKISNTSGIDYSGTCQLDASFAIPQKYGEKIFDFLGKKVSESADNSYVVISGHKAISFIGTNYDALEDSDFNLFFCNRATPDTTSVFLRKATNLSLTNGSSKYISARLPLTLL